MLLDGPARGSIFIYSGVSTGVATIGNTIPRWADTSTMPILLITATIAAVSCALMLLLRLSLLGSSIGFNYGAFEQMHLSSFVIYPFD